MEKATELAQLLGRHQNRSEVFFAPLSEIQKRVIVETPPSYRVLLYRRFMLRIAQNLAQAGRGQGDRDRGRAAGR